MSSPQNKPEWCSLCDHYHGPLDHCIDTLEDEDEVMVEYEARHVVDFIALLMFVAAVLAAVALFTE